MSNLQYFVLASFNETILGHLLRNEQSLISFNENNAQRL